MDSTNEERLQMLERTITALEKELTTQKKTTKNAIKLSIGVGVTCFFFVALNLFILFTIAGGVAGNERKVQSLQEHIMHADKSN